MGHVITFAQQKGGAGKTTLLAHLAHAHALKGKSVALIDLDPQASLTRWAAMADIPGLATVDSSAYRVAGDIRDTRAKYDLTLIDCPGTAAAVQEAAIRESDLVLLPCQPTAMDIWASEATLAMATKEGTPARIILNRVPPRGTAAEDAAKALKDQAKLLKTRIGNRVAFAKGFSTGTTALTLSGQAAAKAEIEALRKDLARLLKAL